MFSWRALPVSLLALCLASPVIAGPSSFNDPFRSLTQARAPKADHDKICCLIKPQHEELPDLHEAEDVLLSFEQWKAKQQAAAIANADGQQSSASSSSLQSPSPTTHPSETQSSPLPSPPSQNESEPSSSTEDDRSPHFRVPITDRFNYANLDCSARVHLSHREAKSSASQILSSKRDRYMLSPCTTSKDGGRFVVVELCDDIRIDTVQLANFEFFSGVFKTINVSVAKTYTMDKEGWVDAGTYTAKNNRGVQSFHPPTSLNGFYRYIRVDFVDHYGSEYYCPVSLLRVYGLTHLEEWKWDLWQAESLAKKNKPAKKINEPSDNNNHNDSTFSSDVNSAIAALDTALISFATTTLDVPPLPVKPLATPTTIIFDDLSKPENVSLTLNTTMQAPTITSRTLASSTAQPPPSFSMPVPSVVANGESIYRTIMNRLTALESSHALYTSYVEAQTSGAREVLKRMGEEIGRLEGMARNQRNDFIKMNRDWELRWIVVAEDRLLLEEQLRRLMDEVTLEKRLGIAQLCLLLTVLVFMGLTRGSRGESAALLVDHFKSQTERSMREWGRRTLSFGSGSWARRRFGSVSPPPSKATMDDPPISVAPLAESPLGQRPVIEREKTLVPKGNATPTSERRSNGFRRPRTPSSARATPFRHHTVYATPVSARSATHMSTDGNGFDLHSSAGDLSSAGIAPRSAKRWARTAHLHEVPGGGARTPMSARPNLDGGLIAATKVTPSADQENAFINHKGSVRFPDTNDGDDDDPRLASNITPTKTYRKGDHSTRRPLTPLKLQSRPNDSEEDTNWVDTDTDVEANETDDVFIGKS